jgi:zinc transport system substrate-binding protein
MRRAAWIAALLLLGLVAFLRLTPSPPPRADRLPVVASFYPLYEFTRQVGGDRVEVTALVPAGVEPHDWEPSPQDMTRLERARLFIYNGAGLEPWAPKLLAAAREGGPVAVNTTEGLALQVADLPRHDHAHAAPAKGEPDPHVWLDPELARAQVEAIRAALARMDPAGAQVYEANARAFTERLAALHGEFEAGLADCARRELFTSHAAFGYLARRYRLTVIPIMGLTPEAEPSPAELARLVRLARRHRIRYVFTETLLSPRLAETLAREVGAQTLVLNPVEGLTREEEAAGTGYVDLMRQNLRTLRLGLECR